MDRSEQASIQANRVYICHTFYHAYVSCLKELNLPKAERGRAVILLSTMSNNFDTLPERLAQSGLFAQVVMYDEKDFGYFKELAPLKVNTGSIFRNMLNRMKFCKKLGQLEEEFMPVDLTQFKDIYVFCDSDPVGYYLAYKKLRYHAVEDGLNCLRYRDTAREDNAGHFGLKAWMARHGFIFIQNGYSKYCIDMEVNDISVLDAPIPNMVEVNRDTLVDALDEEGREILTKAFIPNADELNEVLQKAKETGCPLVLILTEPLCQDLEVRKKLFRDMIAEYAVLKDENGNPVQAKVVIKPHPRDLLDYKKEFAGHLIMDSHFPMEILNFTGAEFERVVTVYTVPSSIRCAKEKVYLGNDFMDRYEDKAAHAHVTHASATIAK